MSQDPVVIVGMARTPMGGFQGDLKDITAPELGASAIRGALDNAKLSADEVNEVIMGNILSAGQGQAPARQASIGAGIPNSVERRGGVSEPCWTGGAQRSFQAICH